MEKQQTKFKILMFPWIAYGHISPYIELAKKLSSTKHFDLYICSTAINLDSIRATLEKQGFDQEAIKLVQLHMPSSPELPPEMHNAKNVPPNLHLVLFKAFQQSIYSFSDIMDSLKPHLLLYDLFQPWAAKIASSKGIPSVFFSTSSIVPFSPLFPKHLTNVPASYKKSMLGLKNYVEKNLKDHPLGSCYVSTDIVLVNSYKELQSKYVDHFSMLIKKKIVCTGPLTVDNNDTNLDDEAMNIMKWLSGKDTGSTVYISFGSECYLSREQIIEIAKGLELCTVNFIWVLRSPAGALEDGLPTGFVERVGERGRVVKWAPQKNILEHSSVCTFVSHCGWNSVMESVYFGVPVVATPMQYEQPINARLIMEYGAGVEVERDADGGYAGVDIVKAIEKTLGEEVRSRAKMLREKIRKEEDAVAEELLEICMKNNVKAV